jgi:cell division cycle protein 37
MEWACSSNGKLSVLVSSRKSSLKSYQAHQCRFATNSYFFSVTTPNHPAQKLFLDDFNTTYQRIKKRAAEIAASKAHETAGQVEQIQLHAVDPNTQIHIVVPPVIDPSSPDATEEHKAARQTFESFPPGLQRALESSSLDEVNKVLAKMSVEEAEEVIQKLSDGGMLSLQGGVIDATTEEGKAIIREIEQTGKMPQGGEDATVIDPGLSAEPAPS